MARVAGITKTNTSVFPEKRGDGFCARMDTRMESVKVFGIVDITVLAAGSIFLGDVHEPIKGTKNPQKILNSGIPFTKKPIAIQFDYKVKMSDREKRVHATGFSKITDVEGKDFPEMNLFCRNAGKTKTEISMPNAWVRWWCVITLQRTTGATMPLIPLCTAI